MPYYTYLFIDMLTLAIRCNRDISEGLSWHLRESEPEVSFRVSSLYRNYQGRRFRFNYLILFDDDPDQYLYIGCSSIDSSPSNLTIEFNPSLFIESGCSRVWEALEWILQDNFDLLESAIVTRLDLSFDVKPLSLDSCHMRGTNLSRSNFYNSPNGQLETINLGSRGSPLSFCNYDKGKQRQERANEVVRFEARIKPNIELSRILRIDNPFERLVIIRSASPYELENLQTPYRIFWEAIENRGYQAALGLLKHPGTRKKYRTKIESILYPDWYNPDELWRSFPQAIRALSCNDFGIRIRRRPRKKREIQLAA